MALMAPWAGRRAKTWGRRPLLLLGFAALPMRALLFAWTTNPTILIAAQVLDGVSGTMLGVLTALVIADLTTGPAGSISRRASSERCPGSALRSAPRFQARSAGSLGRAAGFLGIAAVALAALLMLWSLMPETDPSNKNEIR